MLKRTISAIIITAFIFTQCGVGTALALRPKQGEGAKAVGNALGVPESAQPARAAGAVADAKGKTGTGKPAITNTANPKEFYDALHYYFVRKSEVPILLTATAAREFELDGQNIPSAKVVRLKREGKGPLGMSFWPFGSVVTAGILMPSREKPQQLEVNKDTVLCIGFGSVSTPEELHEVLTVREQGKQLAKVAKAGKKESKGKATGTPATAEATDARTDGETAGTQERVTSRRQWFRDGVLVGGILGVLAGWGGERAAESNRGLELPYEPALIAIDATAAFPEDDTLAKFQAAEFVKAQTDVSSRQTTISGKTRKGQTQAMFFIEVPEVIDGEDNLPRWAHWRKTLFGLGRFVGLPMTRTADPQIIIRALKVNTTPENIVRLSIVNTDGLLQEAVIENGNITDENAGVQIDLDTNGQRTFYHESSRTYMIFCLVETNDSGKPFTLVVESKVEVRNPGVQNPAARPQSVPGPKSEEVSQAFRDIAAGKAAEVTKSRATGAAGTGKPGASDKVGRAAEIVVLGYVPQGADDAVGAAAQAAILARGPQQTETAPTELQLAEERLADAEAELGEYDGSPEDSPFRSSRQRDTLLSRKSSAQATVDGLKQRQAAGAAADATAASTETYFPDTYTERLTEPRYLGPGFVLLTYILPDGTAYALRIEGVKEGVGYHCAITSQTALYHREGDSLQCTKVATPKGVKDAMQFLKGLLMGKRRIAVARFFYEGDRTNLYNDEVETTIGATPLATIWHDGNFLVVNTVSGEERKFEITPSAGAAAAGTVSVESAQAMTGAFKALLSTPLKESQNLQEEIVLVDKDDYYTYVLPGPHRMNGEIPLPDDWRSVMETKAEAGFKTLVISKPLLDEDEELLQRAISNIDAVLDALLAALESTGEDSATCSAEQIGDDLVFSVSKDKLWEVELKTRKEAENAGAEITDVTDTIAIAASTGTQMKGSDIDYAYLQSIAGIDPASGKAHSIRIFYPEPEGTYRDTWLAREINGKVHLVGEDGIGGVVMHYIDPDTTYNIKIDNGLALLTPVEGAVVGEVLFTDLSPSTIDLLKAGKEVEFLSVEQVLAMPAYVIAQVEKDLSVILGTIKALEGDAGEIAKYEKIVLALRAATKRVLVVGEDNDVSIQGIKDFLAEEMNFTKVNIDIKIPAELTEADLNVYDIVIQKTDSGYKITSSDLNINIGPANSMDELKEPLRDAIDACL